MSRSLRARLQADLLPALRAGDRVRTMVLRTTLAAIANAEAVDPEDVSPGQGVFSTEVPRRRLSPADVHAVVAACRDELADAADELEAHDHPEAAGTRRAQAEILDGYLSAEEGRGGADEATLAAS